ncbi:neck passage structure [Lactococcus phage 88605]|uniref:Neck passage structure n=1 Tax=Lactococcus phage 88605 TaxID=2029673 RepID=A0A343JQN0_9CAUD|nr:neck passage structure [Lactococcus phage 88605]ASZ71803.1 neck passage structure [Lactococcus phage 88605]
MSLDNFRNRTIIWDTVNKDFPQPIQIMQGDVNARTLLIKIVDNGVEIDLTGHSLKLTYQYTNSSNSGFVMVPPENLTKGEFILVIPTEMTTTGVIEANLVLLNEDKEQVIVSKNLTFISDNSTVTDLAQEVNNKIDDFTKLLLENMPQVMRSELNDLRAQTDSNKSNIELKANLADMTSLQSAMTELKNEVEAFGISHENLVTIKSLLDAIASNASESEVVELINSVKVLTSNISLMSNGDYSPKANQTDLESLQHTVNDHSATISAKANQTDLNNLQADVSRQGIAISEKAEQTDLSTTNKNVTTAQETANKAESEAKNAMAKATEAQTNSLPINGNAVSSSKLATARKLGVNLQASAFQNFDGTADVTNIGVSGVLPIANGGTSTSDGVINTIAYSNSADGTDDFTTVYPNFNLINSTKDFSGQWIYSELSTDDGTYKGLTVKKRTDIWGGIFKIFTVSKNSDYTFSSFVKGAGIGTKFVRVVIINGVEKHSLEKTWDSAFSWTRDSITFSTKDIKVGDQIAISYNISVLGTNPVIWNAGHKWEEGSTATPYMQSANEVTVADYPKYVGFSNSIKPNKKSSDYKWLPMGLVSIDRATGSLKPAVIGIDYAQAHPVGSVVSNNSILSSGYSTGTWENIGSAVIGSTTIFYWERTA